MQRPEKYYKIGGIILASLLLIILIGGSIAYTKREALLKVAIEKAIRKAKNDYNLNVKIKTARFAGLKTIDFEEISIVPENRDSLAFIKNFKVGIKLFPLILGDIKLAEVSMTDSWISLRKKDSISNYDFLFRKKGVDSVKSSHKVNLAELANNLLNQMLYKIPDDMDIRNFEIRLQENANKITLNTSSATIDNGQVKSTILINGKESVWHVQGSVDPGDKQLDLMLFADGKKVELPYLEKKLGLKLNFDTISTQMKRVQRDGDEFKISGSWAVKNLLVNHPRIASNDIVVPSGSIDADMVFGENYVSIDSTSTIHLQNIEANPFIKYTLGANKIYELKLRTKELDAQQLFDAFPHGLFESLDGMKVTGKLQYDLNFRLDTKYPDQVVFDSRLRKNNFKVVNWGATNLGKINSSFVYTPYEYGKPMRNITIGPQNPDYTPINQISPYLRNALLTAEDPSFYSHNGFVEESIRKSIATNFKEKAFKRGGSTISMQLVKNVYLNRQKTIARKIEEILIVWIIENTNLSSKQRMFEVYLNLIEWGKNVYGIGEASRHYFNKHPSQLDLGESIFLASIVPKPKSGMYYFQGDGTLKTGLRGYFRLIGGIMQRRGLAQPDSNVYGFYGVRLRESLRTQMPPADSLLADSLYEDEEESSVSILQQIFGKRKPDTINVNDIGKSKSSATKEKTPAELRQERREQRRREKEARQKSGGN
ncbi:biosynthetic peptidoglycan transglycosylase [Daejeonella oryzae]|uniref:biosynthetic peptidoglycan transglycosylase n=1 Tax=Daejeonella oryzae TaxID=1122943 RepID=UPI0003F7F078|nr:biosynthetic peptidoglycan transglycosylase [Daejeonella oryzae]